MSAPFEAQDELKHRSSEEKEFFRTLLECSVVVMGPLREVVIVIRHCPRETWEGPMKMARVTKLSGIATLLVILCAAAGDYAAAPDTAGSPVLVELFTSEGCSSCPPADAFLERMDATQPVPGAQLIVLSEHVDYWNHDGWKDPYSSAQLTERQSGYVHSLGLNTPYTPQMIVDGAGELKGNGAELAQLLQKAATAPKVAVRISSLSVTAGSPAIVHAHLDVDGTSQKRNSEIFVVVALDHAESQVLRGENSGRHLTHVAVAQEFIKVGKLEKQKTFSQDFQVKLKPGTDTANIRVIALVQDSGLGKVSGAALQKVTN